MAVCRVEKNKNYTTMSNYHLRDKNLSNKACGLLSKMLSLPDAWDYTTRGLAAICKDGWTPSPPSSRSWRPAAISAATVCGTAKAGSPTWSTSSMSSHI